MEGRLDRSYTFTTTYYIAWRKMDPLISQILFISSVPSTLSSPDSRLIWQSFLLDGMINEAVGAWDAAAPNQRPRDYSRKYGS